MHCGTKAKTLIIGIREDWHYVMSTSSYQFKIKVLSCANKFGSNNISNN